MVCHDQVSTWSLMSRKRQSLGVWLQGLKPRVNDQGSGVASPKGRCGCNSPVKSGDSSSTTTAHSCRLIIKQKHGQRFPAGYLDDSNFQIGQFFA